MKLSFKEDLTIFKIQPEIFQITYISGVVDSNTNRLLEHRTVCYQQILKCPDKK